jgi:hypothetical protein
MGDGLPLFFSFVSLLDPKRKNTEEKLENGKRSHF